MKMKTVRSNLPHLGKSMYIQNIINCHKNKYCNESTIKYFPGLRRKKL